jgi:glycosyltransferase involved in cell wall biosynthesis
MAMMLLGRGFLRDKHVVGYWAWELARAPDDWRAGLTFVHRVLVPSLFTRTAILGLGAPLDVDVLAHPVATQDHGADVQPHSGGSVFTVLTVFNMASGFERKNPIAAVQAFRRAFGASLRARLIVKSVNADHHSKAAVALRSAIAGADNIRHIESTLSPAHLLELYAGSDVVISLHRAEGFGLTIAEGMLASRCVVATDYSGSTDFLSMETGRPIPYRLVPAREPGGEYDWPDQRWAEADVGSAAVTLEELASNSALRRDLGTAAREAALDRFSATAYTQRLLGLLNLDTTMLTTGGAPPQLP